MHVCMCVLHKNIFVKSLEFLQNITVSNLGGEMWWVEKDRHVFMWDSNKSKVIKYTAF